MDGWALTLPPGCELVGQTDINELHQHTSA